jgi:hypothetical protein
MADLSSVLQPLEQERSRLASQLANLNNALSELNVTDQPEEAECRLRVAPG